jgi:hypothetical protein
MSSQSLWKVKHIHCCGKVFVSERVLKNPVLQGPDEDLRLQGRHCLICNFNPDFAVAWYSQAKPFKFE